MRKRASRWLNLLIAPLAVSLVTIIITDLATSQTTPVWLWIVTAVSIIVAILFYVVGYRHSFETVLTKLARKIRARRFQKPHVLILDGTLSGDERETPPVPVHSDRTPTDWRTALESIGWNVETAPVQRITEDPVPDMVINPFGEIYPEADFSSNSTISEIRKYVWNGGVFVNVAGIPFWYRYSPRTGKTENAGRFERIDDNQLQWIPLFNDLFPNLTPTSDPEIVGCMQMEEDASRFGNIAGAGNSQIVGRFRAYPLNPPQLLTMLRDGEQQHCIIGSFLYGQGCLLFAGVFIEQTNASFEKVVAAIKGWVGYEAQGRKP